MQLVRVTLVVVALALAAVDGTLIVTAATGTVATGVAVGAAALAGVGGLALGAGLAGAAAAVGRGGGRRGRRRGRRAADGDELRRELALDVSAAADPAGCALKLICLLEAQPEPERALEADALLQLVGEPQLPAHVQTPRQAYLYAAYLGSVRGAAACSQQFAACAYGLQDMMDYVRRLAA